MKTLNEMNELFIAEIKKGLETLSEEIRLRFYNIYPDLNNLTHLELRSAYSLVYATYAKKSIVEQVNAIIEGYNENCVSRFTMLTLMEYNESKKYVKLGHVDEGTLYAYISLDQVVIKNDNPTNRELNLILKNVNILSNIQELLRC